MNPRATPQEFRTIRELAGEFWSETSRLVSEEEVDWATKNRLADILMAVLVRHAGKVLVNDPGLEVQPLGTPQTTGDTPAWTAELTGAGEGERSRTIELSENDELRGKVYRSNSGVLALRLYGHSVDVDIPLAWLLDVSELARPDL
jgi:hypothetical protein